MVTDITSLLSSPDQKGHVSYCRHPSVNFYILISLKTVSQFLTKVGVNHS